MIRKQDLPEITSTLDVLKGVQDQIAYNVDFDIELLSHELRRWGRTGLGPRHLRLDPYRIYKRQVPDQYRLSGAVRHYLGHEHLGAHRATDDVLATIDVLRRQVARATPGV